MTTIFRTDPSETLSTPERVTRVARRMDAMMRDFGYRDFEDQSPELAAVKTKTAPAAEPPPSRVSER
jgi:hypothetical protein